MSDIVKRVLEEKLESRIGEIIKELNIIIINQSKINFDNEVKKEDKVNLMPIMRLVSDLSSYNKDITLAQYINQRSEKMIIKEIKEDISDSAITEQVVAIEDKVWLELKEEIDYEGFNRIVLMKEVTKLGLDSMQLASIVTNIAYRGPKKAALIKMKSLKGKSFTEVGVHLGKAGKSEPNKITANRLLSLFPELAAVGLLKMGVNKRIHDFPLAAHLQFPAAASLPLSELNRVLHRTFTEEFSGLIGGRFNVRIYESMMTNQVKVSDKIVSLLQL